MSTNTSRVAGIVLCGGESRRMGSSKAWLPVGGETMLQRVVGRVRRELPATVVVAAAAQDLPELPPEVFIRRDEQPGLGPLEALRVGLAAAEREWQAEAAFVCGCDAPFVAGGLIQDLLARLVDHDIAVPVDSQRSYPLTAVYRTRLADSIHALLDQGNRRLIDLLDQAHTLRVPTDVLRHADPELRSLVNLNTPEQYRRRINES